MWEADVGALPVVDREQRLVGMITDRDICMAAYTRGKRLSEMRVEQAMAHEVHAVLDTEGVMVAEDLMNAWQIRRLPVVTPARRLIGIVSLMDLARHVHRSELHVADGLSGDTVARTLAGVGRPLEKA
jgi:CBS domain-containing protein